MGRLCAVLDTCARTRISPEALAGCVAQVEMLSSALYREAGLAGLLRAGVSNAAPQCASISGLLGRLCN